MYKLIFSYIEPKKVSLEEYQAVIDAFANEGSYIVDFSADDCQLEPQSQVIDDNAEWFLRNDYVEDLPTEVRDTFKKLLYYNAIQTVYMGNPKLWVYCRSYSYTSDEVQRYYRNFFMGHQNYFGREIDKNLRSVYFGKVLEAQMEGDDLIELYQPDNPIKKYLVDTGIIVISQTRLTNVGDNVFPDIPSFDLVIPPKKDASYQLKDIHSNPPIAYNRELGQKAVKLANELSKSSNIDHYKLVCLFDKLFDNYKNTIGKHNEKIEDTVDDREGKVVPTYRRMLNGDNELTSAILDIWSDEYYDFTIWGTDSNFGAGILKLKDGTIKISNIDFLKGGFGYEEAEKLYNKITEFKNKL